MLGWVSIDTKICHLVLSLHARQLTSTQHAVHMLDTLKQRCKCKKSNACQWEGLTNLASSCKALQPGNLKEGDDGEHDGSQCVDGQPVLLHHIHFIQCQLSES